MSPSEERDEATLDDLVTICHDVMSCTQGRLKAHLQADRLLFHALSFELAILGEAVKRLSDEFRTRHSEIPWRKIAGMRDRIIRGYDEIDFDELWNAAVHDVPALLKQLQRIRER
jgi:uncharacterized protein with HEPN domain